MVAYLGLEDVVSIHEDIMRRLGDGPQPLVHRSECLAALDRPRWAAYYEQADIVAQAARLGMGLVKAHPFVDGNKRIAHYCLIVFLGLNGLRIQRDLLDLAKEIERLADVDLDDTDAQLDAWLRDRVVPTES